VTLALLPQTTLTCPKEVSLSPCRLQHCRRGHLHLLPRHLILTTSSLLRQTAPSIRALPRLWLASYRRNLDRSPPRVRSRLRRPLLRNPESVYSSLPKCPTKKRRRHVYRKDPLPSPSRRHSLPNMPRHAPPSLLHGDLPPRETSPSTSTTRARIDRLPRPFLAPDIICITSTNT
jgi:hypothetical protein